MKKRNIVICAVLVLTVAAIVSVCVILAVRHRFEASERKTEGIIDQSYQIHDGYVYFVNNSRSGYPTCMRYDPSSDRVEKLCGCDRRNSKCPLEGINSSLQISLNRMYYSSSHLLAYYDLGTGEAHIIKEYPEFVSNFCVYGAYIYHEMSINNYDDMNLYRLSIDGSEETAIRLGSRDEHLAVVADGMIITYETLWDGDVDHLSFYAYDVDTFERHVIWRSEPDVSTGLNSRFMFYDGCLYFVIVGNGWRLCRLDIHSGKLEYIVDDLDLFFVTEDGLYYTKYTLYPSDGEAHYMKDLWRCDLDGGNSRKIEIDRYFQWLTGYFVEGKFICRGWMYVDPEAGDFNDEEFFGVVDLATGSYKDLVLP